MSPDYRVRTPLDPMAEAAPEGDAESADAPWSGEAERRESIVCEALHGARLDKALVAMAAEFSRSHLQTLIEGGHVWLDGRPAATASRRVVAGQRIVVELIPTPQS